MGIQALAAVMSATVAGTTMTTLTFAREDIVFFFVDNQCLTVIP